MLFIVLTILPIITVCVDGTASNEPKHAVSTQSYHRGDVPLSYKYTSVHIYTTPHPEKKFSHQHTKQRNQKFHIQYAPLEQNTYQNDMHKTNYPEQTDAYKDVQIIEQFQYPAQKNMKEHLEPRAEAENMEVHDQNYRSYVPGHNIEVLQSNHDLDQNYVYRAHHDNLQNHKVNIPMFVSHRQPEQHVRYVPENLRAAEQRPLSEEHNILYTFLPRPIVKTQPHAYQVEKPHKLHQALSAKIPRLHLNIARVYGIAHLPQQAFVQPTHIHRPNIGEPLTYTQAIFQPLKSHAQKKTVLYPVQDTNKYYPVQT